MSIDPVPADDLPVAAIEAGVCGIGELAKAYKVSPRTLRFYEDRGLLKPRRDGPLRFYGRRDQRRLESILRGKRLGFTLAEITALVAADGSGSSALTLDRAQIVLQIGHLERQRDGLDGAIAELKAALRSFDAP